MIVPFGHQSKTAVASISIIMSGCMRFTTPTDVTQGDSLVAAAHAACTRGFVEMKVRQM
jgi:hypothetical protein